MEEDLPPELWLEILKFLDARSLGTASRASKNWNDLCNDNSVWKYLVTKSWKSRKSKKKFSHWQFAEKEVAGRKKRNWKQFYRWCESENLRWRTAEDYETDMKEANKCKQLGFKLIEKQSLTAAKKAFQHSRRLIPDQEIDDILLNWDIHSDVIPKETQDRNDPIDSETEKATDYEPVIERKAELPKWAATFVMQKEKEKEKEKEKNSQHQDLMQVDEQILGENLLETMLPPELILEIFKFLDTKSLGIACRASKNWNELCNDNSIWRYMVTKSWRSGKLRKKSAFTNNWQFAEKEVKQRNKRDWKQFFRWCESENLRWRTAEDYETDLKEAIKCKQLGFKLMEKGSFTAAEKAFEHSRRLIPDKEIDEILKKKDEEEAKREKAEQDERDRANWNAWYTPIKEEEKKDKQDKKNDRCTNS